MDQILLSDCLQFVRYWAVCAGFPLAGGGVSHPHLTFFFESPPIKTDAPYRAPQPHLKMKPPPSEKQTPHWNMKHPSIKWFLEKTQ